MSHVPSFCLTPVEQKALAATPFQALYPPIEKIPAIVVDNFPALGRLVALRFLEWAQANPEGVVSLPTGKTPEHFIKWVGRLLSAWEQPETRAILEAGGIDPAHRPVLKDLHFVQIDEFYPIDPAQQNSFFHYVNQYYLEGFGFDPEKALLIDCAKIGLASGETLASVWPDGAVDLSLRYRPGRTERERIQKRVLERVDQWCQEYEARIAELGGIGFFLGGIGPDGHIGFNVRGSDHYSTTRLTATNYETQAAAAADLGGIECSRRSLVITIGLATITRNPRCCAIIIAAGEAKAAIVAAALQSRKNILVPASALQALPQARFYLTSGAAKQLAERQCVLLNRAAVSGEEIERVVIDLAVQLRKRLADLTEEDFRGECRAALLLGKLGSTGVLACDTAWKGCATATALACRVRDSLVKRIEAGARVLANTRFLHTEPHHDDLMLGCLPALVRHMRDPSNVHFFTTLTSGFTAVTNHFMRQQLHELRHWLGQPDFSALMEKKYFEPNFAEGRQRDIWHYLDGVAGNSAELMREGQARRLLRDVFAIFGGGGLPDAGRRVAELLHYFETAYPGKHDPDAMQRLKGARREWEAECLWGYFGYNCANVSHPRLGFYTGDLFSEEPTAGRDVPPVVEMLRKAKPDVVSVALDPEASGPDTHYKVLQAVTEACQLYSRETERSGLRIWGYRNVWYRFHPAEANLYVPVSLNMFAVMQAAFMNTFLSQREASFPSYEHDGPFCELAQKIQAEQYQKLKICMGREWFHEHPSALIRATRGLVFMKEMTLPELGQLSRSLRRAAENR